MELLAQSTTTSGGISGGALLVIFALFGVYIAAFWMIFTKAGEPGWAAIVPIYNTIVLLKIVGRPSWWIFLMFIPFVNLVFLIIAYNDLSKSFGKDPGFTVGLILLPFIFFPILGFGSARYLGPAAQAPAGVGGMAPPPPPPPPMP